MNEQVFKIFPSLRTKRLVLRMLTPEDAEDMVEIAQFKHPDATTIEALHTIEQVAVDFQKKECLTWGLEYDHQLVGTLGFYRGFENDSGEIGYVTKSAFRRKGYMQEAIIRVISFAFDEMALKELTAYTEASNVRSVRLLEGLGFRTNGELFEEYTIFRLPKERFS